MQLLDKMEAVEALALMFVFYLAKRQVARSKRITMLRRNVRRRSRALRLHVRQMHTRVASLALSMTMLATMRVTTRRVWCVPR